MTRIRISVQSAAVRWTKRTSVCFHVHVATRFCHFLSFTLVAVYVVPESNHIDGQSLSQLQTDLQP